MKWRVLRFMNSEPEQLSSRRSVWVELEPSTFREGNHVIILVGSKPLAADFIPSYQSKEKGLPIR